jgi:hypothetical protein
MPSFQWARLSDNFKPPLRRGAWYRILKLSPTEAVLDVRGKPVQVPRGEVEISPTQATRWSVVPAPRNSPRFPASWGTRYAVCPSCRERAQLAGHPASMRCHRCNGLFEVAWNEPDLASA